MNSVANTSYQTLSIEFGSLMLLVASPSSNPHYTAMFFLNVRSITRSHQRWRLAFTAIYATGVLLSLAKDIFSKKKDQLLSRIVHTPSNVRSLTRPHQRWRLAFAAIYATRVFLSLGKDILSKKNDRLLSGIVRSPSYTILDIQPNDDNGGEHEPFFNADQKSLAGIMKLKSLSQIIGVEGVAAVLQTDMESGILGDDAEFTRRKIVFGSNTYQRPPVNGFLSFLFDALKNTTMPILLGCATPFLMFDNNPLGVKVGWYTFGSIACFLHVYVGLLIAMIQFKQWRQFTKLSDESNNIMVEVMRDGRRQQISIFHIVVGDIVFLKIGHQIPADGLFMDGHSLKVDESSMTGESDQVEISGSHNPFLFSGSKVADGYGRMLVTSVGMHTTWGEMMSLISHDLDEQTPLQARLNKLTSYTRKAGLVIAFLVLMVLLLRYWVFNDAMNAVVDKVAVALKSVEMATPEQLMTLFIAYFMKRMMEDGSATTICTDKTGTLTLNQMKITMFWLGDEAIKDDTYMAITPNVFELLQQGACLNTTAGVYRPTSGTMTENEIAGSLTEKAILSWAVVKLGTDMDEVKQSCTVLHVEAFNSEKKCSGVLLRKNSTKTIHVHWKGAAEIILAMCSNYYKRTGTIKAMDEGERMKFEQIIEDMAAKSLRCIGFAHKQTTEEEYDGQSYHMQEKDGLTLLGLVGLKDPCRPGVRTAVEACRDAGVNIKMITGDNEFTPRAIVIECGKIGPDEDFNNEAVVEGVEFRNYSHEDRMEKVDRIHVMARSSAFYKLLTVQCLKQKGHVVALAPATNDAPALKEADIGLSMGIQGTEVAKESSDIIILDDNFTNVATVLRWGRCVYNNNIQKLKPFQLRVNVAALVFNFVLAVSSGKLLLKAVQLLWVNLIMDALGVLAQVTRKPTKELMKKSPVGRSDTLIFIVQALYQVTVLLILLFKGSSILGVNDKVKDTLIFNAFVLCQVFSEFNARNLEEKNIFKDTHKNRLFLEIVGMTVVLQVVLLVVIQEFFRKFANTEIQDWGQCLFTLKFCLGAFMPFGQLIGLSIAYRFRKAFFCLLNQ